MADMQKDISFPSGTPVSVIESAMDISYRCFFSSYTQHILTPHDFY